ncbi:MAG: tetratricopeptide repeat protein [Thermoanaerobaculales bacterium]|jgi:tetratricopeptide (TPR) repeat protein|nr:tetratricopeptide repeat protein [Thermoanaerobaculales bacterium]
MLGRVARSLIVTTSVLVAASGARVATAQLEPLAGTVANSSGRGLKEVRVELRASPDGELLDEQVTDDEGRFAIAMELLRPGQVILLSKPGYEDLAVAVEAQQLVLASLEAVMSPARSAPRPRPPTPTPTPELVSADQRRRAIQLYNEGVALFEEDEPENKKAGESKIREAASLDPDFQEPLQVLLGLAMKRQSWSEASRYAEHLVRLDPNDLETVKTLYTCIVITRHHQRIGGAIRRLVALDPSALTTVEEHASTFFDNKVYPMARAMYEVLAEISPKPAYAYLNLGVSCAALGDAEAARAAFETFLELAPEDDPDRETVLQDLAALADAGG